MRHSVANPLACALVAALLAAACSRATHSPTPPASFAGGGMNVELRVRSAPLRTGENELELRVRDAQGASVDDARVTLQYSMSMAGQPAMGGSVAGQPMGAGTYRAQANLDMSGTWQVAVSVERPDGAAASAQGSLRTGDSVIRLADMEPEPAGESEPQSGAVKIGPERLQKIGVRFATAECKPLVRTVRALGRVTWDESKLVDVAPRIGGFVRELRANALGVRVTQGEPLFLTYSPELYAAQAELLNAAASHDAELVRAARARLRSWSIAEADIAALERHGKPLEALAVRAPASGFVVEKNAVEGAAYEAGTRLFRIAPLDRVWIEADVYASDLASLSVGQAAVVTAPDAGKQRLEATVAAVLPALSSDTRTARVRLEVANGDLALRPEMYVDVALQVNLGERLVVPASAVIVSGERRVVFVDRGEGRLEPRSVRTGVASADEVEIIDGLEPGTRIVTSGNFLIAAESRVQSALEQW